MDLFSSFGATVLEYAVEPISRQFGYLISHGGNVKELKDVFEKLQVQRDSIQPLVEAARINGDEILPDVQKWLGEVDEIEKSVKKFDEEESQAQTECSLRTCPNPWSRYRLSRKVKKKLTPKVLQLKGEGKFERIARPKPASEWIVASSDSFSRGNKAFVSRISARNMIMDALADPTINKIGLCGLPGVGKSTMAHEVFGEAREQLFDRVVIVKVTENPDYRKIQKEIGEMVDLKLDEESEFVRTGRLRERLKKEKNLLVILDDLWNWLDLDKIGIPSTVVKREGDKREIQSTDDYKGCKLLLISRNEEVLSSQMNCKTNITLGTLSDNEAWEMFKEKSEVQVDSEPDLLSTATEVAKECKGLPVAIVTVARALKNKNITEWEHALRQLQNPNLRDVTGLRKEVYAPLKLSYDNLKTKELKLIFLLSSTLSDSVLTSDLFKYCIGLGVFEGIDTIEGAEGCLDILINKLKASYLFSDSSSRAELTMHDLVRNVALSILSDDKHALIVRFKKFNEWPKRGQSENYKWISLYESEVGELPERLSCPELEFFHLNNNDEDLRIPNDFFKELRGLRVMDLTGVNLLSLPNSINDLKNLRTLCLDLCILEDISMIGELKNLRALSLMGSTIQQLPCELGKLTQLLLLDLKRCSELRVIPPNVISKLEKLEKINLRRSFNQWQYEEPNNGSSANASLSELMNLPNLSTLHIHIPHVSMLRKDMFSDRLKKYKILIGDVWEWSYTNKTTRTLKLKFDTSIHSDTSGVKELTGRVEDLFLDEVNGIKSVLYELNSAGFPYLKHLQIQNNSQIECIVKAREFHVAFPRLETLVLKNMIQLEKLCDGQLPVNPFNGLTVIKVQNCDKLNSLFPVSIMRSLRKLVEIEVSGCKLMQEIVDLADQEIDDEGILEFDQLRILTMNSLPAFVSFCSYDKRRLLATAPWKEKQFEKGKPNPSSQHLFSNKVAFPHLETLKLSSINIQNIWHDSISAISWPQNLTDLSVEDCQSLRHIMPIAVARGFVKLKHLKICRCEMVEMIIFPTPNATHTSFSGEVVFPSLETMVISHMENLQMIWPNQFAPDSYGKIKKVKISYCHKLITIIPSHLLYPLNNLEELEVCNCDNVEAVFDLPDIKESHTLPQLQLKSMKLWHLQKLKCVWNKDPQKSDFIPRLLKLEAYECESLRSIFPASIAKHLPQLVELTVSWCPGIKVIVERDEVAGAIPCFVFPQVSSLMLWSLPNLRNFYPERHTCEWPQLRELNVCLCNNLDVFETKVSSITETGGNDDGKTKYPLCLIEKVIPRLKVLSLDQKAITKIKNSQFQDDLFHDVEFLILESFLDDDVPFPYDFLGRFPNTEELYVYNCSFEEIFPRQLPLGVHTRETAPFKNLTLGSLHKLKNIWNEDHQAEQVLQNLQRLEVNHCDALVTLAPSSASFDNLTNLEVSGCHQLVYLIKSATAKTLVHLMRLKINDCKLMEEIVTDKDESAGSTIVLQKLEYLELTGLSSLKAFCSSEKCTWIFPSLYRVIVKGCPRLSMFCGGALDTPILEGVKAEENRVYWDDNLNKTIRNLLVEKVAFRNMEKITLVEYPDLRDIWEGKLSDWSFNGLKFLIVTNCGFLSYAIPSHLLNSLNNLEELNVSNCNGVEAVFDLQDIKEKHTLPQLRLKSITLSHLPKLKSVWNKDPQQIDFCQHLQKINAWECESLRSIFPASIAKHLPNLEELRISQCSGVEVIVEKDEVAGVAPCFEFPQVHTLILWKLPNLKNFYPETHTSEWPRLRALEVYMCKNVEVFGSEMPSTAETQEKDKLEARHPLFFVEKVVHNLEQLVLNQKDVIMIWNGQFPTDLFHKVKLLYLESFNQEPVTFPYSFLERFPNLIELHVNRSSFEEIFPSRGATGNNLGKYAPLKRLKFGYLEQLKIIWQSESQLELVIQNLEGLRVECCSGLTNLAPSSASFDSLSELDVFGCHQLIYLVTSSTAKTLVHLRTLKVKDCKIIGEIIADEGENEEKEIPLKELECLELTDLPSLESFCSQDCKFKLPSLRQVTVEGCPNMKKFCPGVLATPWLQGVIVEENKKHWEGDLNKTIEQLFLKKDGQNSSEG